MPSRTIIDKEMTQVLIELKGKVSAKIKDSSKVSICVDIWTKKGTTKTFLGVLQHTLSLEWITGEELRH